MFSMAHTMQQFTTIGNQCTNPVDRRIAKLSTRYFTKLFGVNAFDKRK